MVGSASNGDPWEVYILWPRGGACLLDKDVRLLGPFLNEPPASLLRHWIISRISHAASPAPHDVPSGLITTSAAGEKARQVVELFRRHQRRPDDPGGAIDDAASESMMSDLKELAQQGGKCKMSRSRFAYGGGKTSWFPRHL